MGANCHLRTFILVSAVMISIIFTLGCLEIEGSDEIDIVIVTILPQKEVVSSIAGQDVEVVVMVPPGQDPHSYDPLPSQLKKVSLADIYFMMGSGIEFELNHLSTLREQNGRMRVVDCSENITVKTYGEHIEEGTNASHTEDGHDHEGIDPHIWLSPRNMRIIAENVLQGLIEADPENEARYRSNFDSYIIELDALIVEMDSGLAPFNGSTLMVYHPSFGYLCDDHGLRQLEIEEGGRQPGPRGVAAIIDQAKEENISVIFVTPQFDTASAETIAEEIGGSVVVVDDLPENYIRTMKDIWRKMAEGFSGGSGR